MSGPLDKVLAAHCAPVLLGAKPGALFTLECSADTLLAYSEVLYPLGVCFLFMAQRGKRKLLYVYRPSLLDKVLFDARVYKALDALGYPVDGGLAGMLGHLQARIKSNDGFPHEIGFFLGYPADDVLGFIQHKGQSYKLCGTWKVYGDVEAARAQFSQHSAYTQYLLQKVEAGQPLCRACMRWHGERSTKEWTRQRLYIGAAQATQRQWQTQ